MKDPEKSLLQVQWALQEAYKMAVKLRGIYDWSTLKPLDREKATREVEEYQLKIAELILEEARSQ